VAKVLHGKTLLFSAYCRATNPGYLALRPLVTVLQNLLIFREIVSKIVSKKQQLSEIVRKGCNRDMEALTHKAGASDFDGLPAEVRHLVFRHFNYRVHPVASPPPKIICN
jgi:SPX domain protein involved in polyphosphate accumulation